MNKKQVSLHLQEKALYMLYLSCKGKLEGKMIYDLQLMIAFFLSGSEDTRKGLREEKNLKAAGNYCKILKSKPFLAFHSYMDFLIGSGFRRSMSSSGRDKTEKYGYTLM